jgi:hypothetical protein
MAGAHSHEMRRYDRKDKEHFVQYHLFSDLNKLRYAAADIAAYSTRVVRLFQTMYLEQGLEK